MMQRAEAGGRPRVRRFGVVGLFVTGAFLALSPGALAQIPTPDPAPVPDPAPAPPPAPPPPPLPAPPPPPPPAPPAAAPTAPHTTAPSTRSPARAGSRPVARRTERRTAAKEARRERDGGARTRVNGRRHAILGVRAGREAPVAVPLGAFADPPSAPPGRNAWVAGASRIIVAFGFLLLALAALPAQVFAAAAVTRPLAERRFEIAAVGLSVVGGLAIAMW
jgi:hypothetical protein